MDNNKMWIFGLEDQGPLTFNKINGIKYSVGQISNDITKAMLLATNFGKAIEILRTMNLFRGIDPDIQYKGLSKDNNNIIIMNYDIEQKLYEEAKGSYPQYESIVKFLSDYCKIGRMRQEFTIDYAKKLTDLSGIKDLLTDKVVASGLKMHKVSFDKNVGVNIDYDTVEDLIDQTKGKKIIFEDPIHEVQKSCMSMTKNLVDGDRGIIAYLRNYTAEAGEDERWDKLNREVEAELSRKENPIFLFAKNTYKDTVACMSISDGVFPTEEEEYFDSDPVFKDSMERIQNMVRLATPDMSPIERAVKLKATARRRQVEDTDEVTENKFYMQICREEYLLWLISLGFCEIPFVGEKLYQESDKDHEIKEGDIIEFEDGEYADYFREAYIEVPYTGKLQIFSKDGTLYAGKPIAEAIKVPEPDKNITVRVDSNIVVGHGKEIFDQLSKRAHNKTVIRKINIDGKDKYFMYFRTCSDEKVKIPVYLPKDLENIICGQCGIITNVRINTVNNAKGVKIPVIYVDIDY